MQIKTGKNIYALTVLINSDPDLRRIYREVGPPNFWYREAGFAGLLQIILEQQVSLASARAVFNKLSNIDSGLTPDSFLKLSDKKLRSLGFSRQKILYCRILSAAAINGEIDFSNHETLPDSDVKNNLTSIKGIGNWTADCYLIFCLDRLDIWPSGDLAINKTLKILKGLDYMPDFKESNRIAEAWKPYRSIAARLLWHYYLSGNLKSVNRDN
jgi:DNA-3-methyladenine glycosylase II